MTPTQQQAADLAAQLRAHGRDDAVFNAHIARARAGCIREYGVADEHGKIHLSVIQIQQNGKKKLFPKTGKV